MGSHIFNIHSLQGKIFYICLSIAMSIMGVTLVVVYQTAANTIERNARMYVQENIAYLNQNLDGFIGDAVAITLSISANPYLTRDYVVEEYTEASYSWFLAKREVEGILSAIISNKNHIRMAAIVRDDGVIFQNGGHLLRRSIVDSWWWESAWNAANVQIYYNTPDVGDVLVSRPVYFNGRPVAVALVELNREALYTAMNMAPLEHISVTIVDEGDMVVLANGMAESGEHLLPRQWEENLDFTSGGTKYLAVADYSETTGLKAVGVIPYEELLTDALTVRHQAMLIALMAVFAAVLASLAFSRLVTRGLQRLQSSMMQIEQGEINARVEITGSDEISEMARVFNRMMDRIAALIRQVKDEEQKKNLLQQEVLETQIQPHFIYNAINSLKYTAHMQKQWEIESIATALTELIRSVLGSRDKYITLWEERTYIEGYITIQRFKYRTDFQLVWEIEETLWSMEIPKLLLQPIVENALLHGISLEKCGVIQVKGYRSGSQAVLQVIDNGRGMTGEQVDSLLSGDKSKSRFRHVGLRNVLERIQSIYGENGSATIDSVPDTFTCVELRLPLDEAGGRGCGE